MANLVKLNRWRHTESNGPTSFPGFLILTLAPGVKMRDPGNEVANGHVKMKSILDKKRSGGH